MDSNFDLETYDNLFKLDFMNAIRDRRTEIQQEIDWNYEDKNGKVDEVLVNYSEVSEPEIYEFDNKQYLSIKLQKENFNINELPIQAIKDCLKYCENHQIYDKLSKYGDFYYKLNTFLKDNHLN